MSTSGTATRNSNIPRFAYVHCKPNGTVFYVGKGALRRVKNLRERNPYHRRVVAKYGKSSILIGMMECSSEQIAFDLERGLIKCLKRQGVALVNCTDGGEGGSNPRPETRAKLSAAAKKRGVSEACRVASRAARKGQSLSEEQRQKQSEAMKGVVFTAEHRKSISISAKKRGISAATRAAQISAISKSVIGVHLEHGEKTFPSAKATAEFLGAPLSTTAKKIAHSLPYMGWIFRYTYGN